MTLGLPWLSRLDRRQIDAGQSGSATWIFTSSVQWIFRQDEAVHDGRRQGAGKLLVGVRRRTAPWIS